MLIWESLPKKVTKQKNDLLNVINSFPKHPYHIFFTDLHQKKRVSLQEANGRSYVHIIPEEERKLRRSWMVNLEAPVIDGNPNYFYPSLPESLPAGLKRVPLVVLYDTCFILNLAFSMVEPTLNVGTLWITEQVQLELLRRVAGWEYLNVLTYDPSQMIFSIRRRIEFTVRVVESGLQQAYRDKVLNILPPKGGEGDKRVYAEALAVTSRCRLFGLRSGTEVKVKLMTLNGNFATWTGVHKSEELKEIGLASQIQVVREKTQQEFPRKSSEGYYYIITDFEYYQQWNRVNCKHMHVKGDEFFCPDTWDRGATIRGRPTPALTLATKLIEKDSLQRKHRKGDEKQASKERKEEVEEEQEERQAQEEVEEDAQEEQAQVDDIEKSGDEAEDVAQDEQGEERQAPGDDQEKRKKKVAQKKMGRRRKAKNRKKARPVKSTADPKQVAFDVKAALKVLDPLKLQWDIEAYLTTTNDFSLKFETWIGNTFECKKKKKKLVISDAASFLPTLTSFLSSQKIEYSAEVVTQMFLNDITNGKVEIDD